MPSLRNILVNPSAEVRWLPKASDGAVVEVQVAGLLCNAVCARRVGKALRGLPGVTEVRFQGAGDTFLVRFGDTTPPESQFHQAVRGQVVLPGLRRWLERAGRGKRSSPD